MSVIQIFAAVSFLELYYSIIFSSHPIYAESAGEVVMYKNTKLGGH